MLLMCPLFLTALYARMCAQMFKEIIQLMVGDERYSKIGATLPKGVLLEGPPGTGKTLLAKAVACEAGVPFFSANGSEFVEMFVGVAAARVRDLFRRARRVTPAIVFIGKLQDLVATLLKLDLRAREGVPVMCKFLNSGDLLSGFFPKGNHQLTLVSVSRKFV